MLYLATTIYDMKGDTVGDTFIMNVDSLNARQIVNSAKDINMKSENSLIILKD